MHLNLVLQILSNSMISKPVIGQFMLDWKNRHFGMDQSQFINSLTLPIHQILNAKVMYSNVLYPYYTDIVLMLYYLPFFSFCKYVQCNFFNNIFIFLRTIFLIRSQGRPEKYGRVSTVPKVFLPNSLQTTFTSITLFNWDSFHFFFAFDAVIMHVLITYWIKASKPSASVDSLGASRTDIEL